MGYQWLPSNIQQSTLGWFKAISFQVKQTYKGEKSPKQGLNKRVLS